MFKRIFSCFFLTKETPIHFSNFPDIAQHRLIISELLEKNKTPLFITDRSIILDRFHVLRAALETHWRSSTIVAYSFKTNYAAAQTDILKKEGAWAEVVSGKEYQMARRLDYEGKRIIFNGPFKTADDLTRAFQDQALVHMDNFEELARAVKITQAMSHHVDIGIRINVPIPSMNKSRFGFSLENGMADRAGQMIATSKNLSLVSVHVHVGTDTDDGTIYKNAAIQMAAYIGRLSKRNKKQITYVDIGGGFPSSGVKPYGKQMWNPLSINNYIAGICEGLDAIKSDNMRLIVEPGRYLIDDATVFVCQIVSCREDGETQTLTMDATVTMLPLKYYRPQIVRVYTEALKEKGGRYLETTLFGASCREDDVLYVGKIPKAHVGEYIIFYCVGAYNQNMSSEFIFEKPLSVMI